MKYFTVGPTQLHKNFSKHLKLALKKDIPSISHRSPEFKILYLELIKNIKKLFQTPEEYDVVFLGSATEFMERAIQNLSEKKTLHFVSGAFGERCYKFAKNCGREVVKIEREEDDSFSLEKIPKEFMPEVIFITHNETSSGHQIPESFIINLRRIYPEVIIACDVVSSAPTAQIPVQDLDLIFFSIQKAFGLPAGLGVGIVSPKLLKQAEKVQTTGGSRNVFHSFLNMAKNNREGKTMETPNVLSMFLLNEVTKDFLKIGIKKIIKNREDKLRIFEKFFKKQENFLPVVRNESWRSKTVLVYQTKVDSGVVVGKLKKKGFQIATGYGDDKATRIRIANFPQTDTKDVGKLLTAIKSVI